ncbi:diguanylate cyclase [Sulfurimonas sp. SAG-AH-194-I05]|nr:GGDEF domain-containing protein [Sulfurimonas sp. SAG-AH-194-I05]MDF1874656.1 diguanylate cyclase [Sulfurimonas sp. SAG-AH-194-I05]
MTIQSIIKKAIKRLELEGKLLTPDFYAEAFCKEATKAGMNTEDCNHVNTIKKMMNKDFQKDLVNYRITTMQELSRFLVAKLNRTSPTQCGKLLESQTLLLKKVIQVLEVLHNKEAKDLAVKSLDLLNASPSSTQMDQFKQLWSNFITTYDDTFLNTLTAFGSIDKTNLKKSIENLKVPSESFLNIDTDLSKVSALLIASLVPSIASSVNEKIAGLSSKIRKNPELLDTKDIIAEVKAAISLRIALDKDSVKEMVQSIDGVLDKLSLRLIDMIEKSDNSTIEIQKIKVELESYNTEETNNFKTAHKKLYTIALALEQNTQLLSKDLKNHDGEVKRLANKIRNLEKELEAVKEESKEDFLTKLYNRRALDESLNIKEAEYKRYGHNFCILMFDLDHFKKVNDTYGHDAGDAVLAAFAKIIKQEARTVDVIGRFGGEEFLGVLSETNTKGGVVFAEKVRKHVLKARFMYKGSRIEVTVSIGIAERDKHVSLDAVLKSADEYLYQAKNEGRNQVAYKK